MRFGPFKALSTLVLRPMIFRRLQNCVCSFWALEVTTICVCVMNGFGKFFVSEYFHIKCPRENSLEAPVVVVVDLLIRKQFVSPCIAKEGVTLFDSYGLNGAQNYRRGEKLMAKNREANSFSCELIHLHKQTECGS